MSFSGNLEFSLAGGFTFIRWVDAITGVQLISGNNNQGVWVSSSAGNVGSGSRVDIIYTPSANQTVRLEGLTGSGTSNIRIYSPFIHNFGIVQELGVTAN
ncbi:hypothetical protein CHU92_06045 [Flavobacterium cyanobacteriorum]|uniref:Uncharacterized protein n=1 Tax=Flavobacterium cyanobacteriorum TaxID=2022802 RepID=A0A255Z9T6_9FLAO|nr:hypothetical protein [Flavobacterium cyanobacteriorum]OYQ38238.1 hypothetical protein CHU92_06045 [Flavobacterium cyanobacteriorum]